MSAEAEGPTPTASQDMAQTTAQLRADHRNDASALEQELERLSAVVGWSGFVVALAAAIVIWLIANLAMARIGLKPLDPPPFVGLQVVASAGALLMAALIFSTQRRDSQLDSHRDELVLELSVLTDQKVSKIIELLEEHRRDNPVLEDRVDSQAEAMATPTDAQAVLEAIRDVDDASL